jgi:hypothetical protein
MRRILLALVVPLLAFALALGCGSSAKSTDGGAAKKDSAVKRDVPRADSGGGGGLKCAEIIQCVNACQDKACFDACVAKGAPASQQLFNAAVQCIVDKCATECGAGGSQDACIACQQQKCGAELQACINDGGGGGNTCMTCVQQKCGTEYSTCTNDAACMGILQCVSSCADQTCMQNCVTAASQAAQQMFMALNNCVMTSCSAECQ